MAKGMGWPRGKGLSLWLGKPGVSSAPCLIPSSSVTQMLIPPGIAQLDVISQLQSPQLDYFFFPLSI